MGKKPRSDAPLKNLAPKRQEQVIEWCDTPKSESCPGGYQHAREQLAADGLRVSLRALSDFWSWWHLNADMDESFEVEDAVLRKSGDPRKARDAAETWLIRAGLTRKDPKLILAASQVSDNRRRLDLEEKSGETKAAHKERALDQKDRDFALVREKFITQSCEKIMLAARDPKVREVVESAIPQAEKIAFLRQEYFKDIDNLEVELPA